MDWKSEWKPLLAIAAVFLVFFFLPVGAARFDGAVDESLHLAKWYAREHVLFCLVTAFFIAGAIGVFVSQASVMKYLGPRASKALAYGVASVSGSILAVCSCTILPLFMGIYKMGAGLGPAVAFLYSGPAISVLAIILTARVLGPQMGIARAVGAVCFSLVIGVVMHGIYRKEEQVKADVQMNLPEPPVSRPLWQNALFFVTLVGILVFANWGSPREFQVVTVAGEAFVGAVIREPGDSADREATTVFKITEGPEAGNERALKPSEIRKQSPLPGVSTTLWRLKWGITIAFSLALAVILVLWHGLAWWRVTLAALPAAVLALFLPMDGLNVMIPFAAGVVGLSAITSTDTGEAGSWFAASWDFAKKILPVLLLGVLVSGFLLGRPGHEGFIPGRYVTMLVGAAPDTFLGATGWAGGAVEGAVRTLWPLWTCLFASVFGAFMYFATLTEVPILQGLIGSGMGKGPALALLLSGPSLSLPSLLVIRGVLGTRKTVVYTALVIGLSALAGLIFGAVRG